MLYELFLMFIPVALTIYIVVNAVIDSFRSKHNISNVNRNNVFNKKGASALRQLEGFLNNETNSPENMINEFNKILTQMLPSHHKPRARIETVNKDTKTAEELVDEMDSESD
jgi:hypothetical protein